MTIKQYRFIGSRNHFSLFSQIKSLETEHVLAVNTRRKVTDHCDTVTQLFSAKVITVPFVILSGMFFHIEISVMINSETIL